MKKSIALIIFVLNIIFVGCGPVTPSVVTTAAKDPEIIVTHPELEVITPANVKQLEMVDQWGKGYVSDVDISPDGDEMAVYTATGIYLYDTSTFEEVKIEFAKESVFQQWPDTGAVQYSPDGRILAFGIQNIHFWNFTTNRFESELINHFPNAQVIDFNFSPDGNYIILQSYVGLSSLCEDTGINLALYDIKNNQMLFDVPYCRTVGSRYIFTENDKLYIFLSATAFVPVPYRVLVIKTSTGELLEEIIYPLDDIQAKRLYNVSVDDKALAYINFYGDSHVTQVIDRSASMPPVELIDQAIYYTSNKNRRWVHKGAYKDFQYSKGKFDLQDNTGRVLCSFENSAPLSMSFSDDGSKAVFVSFPSRIELWSIHACSASKTFEFPKPSEHLFFSPNGKYIAATDSWTIHLWDVMSREYKYTVPVFSLLGNSPPFDFSFDSSALITLRENEDLDYSYVEIDLETGVDKHIFGDGDVWTNQISGSVNQNFASSTQYASLTNFEIWGLGNQEMIAKFSGESLDVSYNRDKSKAALFRSGVIPNVIVVDLNTGESLYEFSDPEAVAVDFLSDTLLGIGIGRYDSNTSIWTVIKANLEGNSLGELGSITQSCSSRNKYSVEKGYMIYVCEDHRIQLLDVENGHVKNFIGHYHINDVNFQRTTATISPDRELLISWSIIDDYKSRQTKSELRFWGIATGALLNEFQSNYSITEVRLSPDGRLLAYLSKDGIIHILGVPLPLVENEN